MPDLARRYFAEIRRLLDKAERTQVEAVRRAGEVVADVVAEGGALYTFGTGHSHMLAEELYVRAGGLARVEAILEPGLMLHVDAERSTELERQEGLAAEVLADYDLGPEDALIVISNSGRNAVPIEMALLARERGTFVIALTSLTHSRSVTSRHSSGLRLFEVADLVLDNGGVVGDAVLEVEGHPRKIGPTSTVIGATLLNAVVAAAVEELVSRDVVPRVFLSSNVDRSNEDEIRVGEH